MAIMNAAARAAAAAAEKAKAKAPIANQKPAGGLLGAAAQTVANEVGKATAAKAAAAQKATEAQKQMAQKAQLASANKLAELQKANAVMQLNQAKQAIGRPGATTGGPKPAPQIEANIPPAIRGAQGNDMIMSPRAGATTGGPKPATVSAYNPKEGVGVTAATPRPLAGQRNDMMMGAPATGGIAPARPAAAVMKKKGGKIKAKSSYSSGGGVKSSASRRGDGIAQRGKTKGRMV